MDEDLWQAITGKEALDEEELDSKRKEMLGVGWDELEEEWENMVKFSYNMAQYDEVLSIEELGAATSIVIVVLDMNDIEEPGIEDEQLLRSMASQSNYVGEIARYMMCEDEITLSSAGTVDGREGSVQLEVWT